MRLLIDEDVPDEVATFLIERGHEVVYVRDQALGEDDPVVAKLANEMDATVVTFNTRDWRRLISKRPQEPEGRGVTNVQPFPRAGRISFRFHQLRGLQRLEQVIESIEFEYQRAQGLRDKRLIIEIDLDYFRVYG